MAKTAAERKRESRAKMTVSKKEEVKVYDRERRRKTYATLSLSGLQKHRRQAKAGMQKLRQRRAEATRSLIEFGHSLTPRTPGPPRTREHR